MEKALKKYSPIFVLPTLLAFTICFIIPFAEGLYLSFCQFTTVKNAKFIGIGNYQRAFSDASFLNSFGFTVKYAVVAIVLINRITVNNKIGKIEDAIIRIESMSESEIANLYDEYEALSNGNKRKVWNTLL